MRPAMKITRLPLWLVAACALAVVAPGCGDAGEEGAARRAYNQALEAFETGAWDEAARGFLQARDEAGRDPELRFRAAFNLALTHAREADELGAEEPEKALELRSRSAGWLRDAARLRPDDADTAFNLEVVLRRIQVLADQISRGENSLEARLDRLIEDQRGVRDAARQLMTRVQTAGAATEPLAFQREFEALAERERSLLAEAGTISDLAGDELGLLESRGPDQLSDHDMVRMSQLRSLDGYVHNARADLADARRLLRQLRGDAAQRRTESALAALIRAREQLLDPIAVLKLVAGDQAQLAQHTAALAAIEAGTLRLDGADEPAQAPVWLTPAHLDDRQRDARGRLAELAARLRAGVEAGAGGAAADADPGARRTLEAAAEALPHLTGADEAMGESTTALLAGQLHAAGEKQRLALEHLLRAIERFAGMRELIELAYRDQGGAVTLLTPPEELGAEIEAEHDAAQVREALAAMSTAERARLVGDAVDANRDRLARLARLFADELATLDADPAAAGAPGAPPPDPDTIEAERRRYELAEEHRAAAAAALERLAAAVATARGGRAGPAPRQAAAETLEHIEELRRLFYSIIEHLQELLRKQAETHDRTASAHGAYDDERLGKLGPLADFQAEHTSLADLLGGALAEQADEAAVAEDPDAAAAAERLAAAAVEVQAAAQQMRGAAGGLGEARDVAEVMSYDLEPVLTHQQAAMQHLAEALRLLQPPQDQDQEDQDQDQGDGEQQPQHQSDEQVSQQEAERRLQAIRDREADRQRERRERQRIPPEPVEQDW